MKPKIRSTRSPKNFNDLWILSVAQITQCLMLGLPLIEDIPLCFYNIIYIYRIRNLQSKTQQFFYFVLKTL